MRTDRRAEDEAISWRLRLRDADGDAWLGFAAWIEADPIHADAYALVSLADADAAETLNHQPAAPDDAGRRTEPAPAVARATRRRLVGSGLGAAAAAVFAVALVGGAFVLRSSSSVIATGAGQRRTIDLADGTRIDMNGGTRIALDSRRPRSVELISGEASFSVRHDPAMPFEVRVGDVRLSDVGTAFNVVRERDGVGVAVASGAVLYNPDGAHVQLDPGDALYDPDGPGRILRMHVDPASAGDWRAGRLVFRRATLDQVAQALTRSTGVPITVAPAIASRSFDGVIVVRRNRALLFRRLGPVLGVSVQHVGSGIGFAPPSRARE